MPGARAECNLAVVKKPVRLLATLVAVLAMCGCAALRPRAKTTDELIAAIAAPRTSRSARLAASDELKKRPPAEVLPGVFDVMRRHAHAFCQAENNDLFADGLPVTWQMAAEYTANYAWRGNLANRAHTTTEKGKALLGILAERKAELCHHADPQCDWRSMPLIDLYTLFQGLQENCADAAEAAEAAMVADGDLDSGCRQTAAQVLVHRTGTRYLAIVLPAAEAATLRDQQLYARLLLEKKLPSEWEARALRFAVGVMRAERTSEPENDSPGNGIAWAPDYEIARAMERHVGARFQPDELTHGWQRRTVDNALAWWEAHKAEFEK